QNTVLLSRQRLLGLFVGIVRGLRVLLLVLVSFIYLATVFGLFQATQNWANALLGYIYRPVSFAAGAFVGYLPNLFFIILVIVATRYVIKFTGFLFREVERGTIEIPGFYDDWAGPTHKILSVILIAFAAVIAFPYLPGANSDAFKGISLFLGFMLSLGSSAIIANIMAGVVITYMRPFRVGDRVKIGETEGDILEKTLLVTRIRTVKNVEITIPNGAVLSSHIINYSTTVARKDTEGLILHSTVTIGYDVPHAKVQKLLIKAAKSLDFVKKSPEPFVLQTSLDDYYVSYQINCYTDRPDQMARIYSNLHEKILEQFNKAGIEIMSPHYYALRDGSSTALPEDSPGANPSAGFPLRWRKEK
ncbi:MAG: mechanosensitive ion channel family protein, partial [Leptospiraceae bacterium]|nr:mechanosensitive ion channel family protein [Leptospiraceae bacterium]